jgi:hypothetical protein
MGKFLAIAVTLSFSLTVGAGAQGYVIQRPGQPPTNVNPLPGGGYKIQSPGQTPSLANPRPGGGYTIQNARTGADQRGAPARQRLQSPNPWTVAHFR